MPLENKYKKIQLSYRHNGDDKELPYKVTLLSKYNPSEKKIPVKDIKPININKENFENVMQAQKIILDFDVKNELDEDEEKLNVNLEIELKPSV